MTVERALRLIAGTVVIVSGVLAIYVSPNFVWLALVVGISLFQSGFTNWCPMMTILRWAGLRDAR
jgi:hypothetical protein